MVRPHPLQPAQRQALGCNRGDHAPAAREPALGCDPRDDLAGHVLAQEDWDVVRLPAIAEADELHRVETVFGSQIFGRKASAPAGTGRQNYIRPRCGAAVRAFPAAHARDAGPRPSLAGLLASPQAVAPNAYITNQTGGTVSVIDTATNTVTATIPVGSSTFGVAVTPDGRQVYVTNGLVDGVVSVIDTATNTVTRSIAFPDISASGVAVTPDGTKAYITNGNGSSVSVIETATGTVIKRIFVRQGPGGVAVAPDGSKVYVENSGVLSIISTASNEVIGEIMGVKTGYMVVVTPDGGKVYVSSGPGPGPAFVSVINTNTNTVIRNIDFTDVGATGLAATPDGTKVYVTNDTGPAFSPPRPGVSVINTASDQVAATIFTHSGSTPIGVGVTPDGSKAYVAGFNSASNVFVIDTATNTVIGAPINAGGFPRAFGIFISTPPAVCVDVSGNSLDPQTPMIINDCHAGPNQQFQWAGPILEGQVIYAEGGHTCLGALQGGTADGTPVVSSPCASGQLAQQLAQRWNYVSGQVINVNSSTCLDRGHLQHFPQLVINSCDGSNTQQWQIK